MVLLAGLHVALNWDWILKTIRQLLPQKDSDTRGPALVMREVFSSLGSNRDTDDDFGGNRRRYHRGSLHTSSSLRSVPILAAGYYVYGLDAESTFDLFLPHFFSLFLNIPAGP